jgi:hypothetical protein
MPQPIAFSSRLLRYFALIEHTCQYRLTVYSIVFTGVKGIWMNGADPELRV